MSKPMPISEASDRGRFSARRKTDAILRLLRGEDLEALSREYGVAAATLSSWREALLDQDLGDRPLRAVCPSVKRGKESFLVDQSCLDGEEDVAMGTRGGAIGSSAPWSRDSGA